MNASRLLVRLYTKDGCHLCEQAEAELARLRRRYPHTLQSVDITCDADLLQRYGERIPVVVIADQEYAAPLQPSELERALASAVRIPAAKPGEADPYASRSASDKHASRARSDPDASRPESDRRASRPQSDPKASRSASDPQANRSASDPQASHSESNPGASRSEPYPHAS